MRKYVPESTHSWRPEPLSNIKNAKARAAPTCKLSIGDIARPSQNVARFNTPRHKKSVSSFSPPCLLITLVQIFHILVPNESSCIRSGSATAGESDRRVFICSFRVLQVLLL